jgi:hypothetical protein
MERRKFVFGLGALSAGGAAAMGTGALSMSDARRDMTAEVVGDRSAYIALIPTSAYATIDNGQLSLHFDENTQGTDNAAEGRSAEGLNQDSYNRFTDVFKIVNNTPEHETNEPLVTKIVDDHPRFQFSWSDGENAGKKSGEAGTVLENGEEVSVDLTINLLDHESMGDLIKDNPSFKIWSGEV